MGLWFIISTLWRTSGLTNSEIDEDQKYQRIVATQKHEPGGSVVLCSNVGALVNSGD